MGQKIGHCRPLPPPNLEGNVSLEQALQERRSIREYSNASLDLREVSQILWSAQGITHGDGYRTAAAAGALYPLEIYLVSGDVSGLSAGIYRYRPKRHELELIRTGDVRARLSAAALNQTWMRNAPAVIAITAVHERTAKKYGRRASRYIHMEVGHAAQNVYLQATALDLATVLVGAFEDLEVQKILGMPDDHVPLGLMPLGHKP